MEEWLSIAERRARAKAITEMKRTAKEAGYKNARIEVKEKSWNGKEGRQRREKGLEGGKGVKAETL